MELGAVYPPGLTKEVFERFRSLDELNRPVELPSEPVVGMMLEVSFLASLLKEESRQIEFRLGYCHPDRLMALSRPDRGFHWMPFESPRTCSAPELRRLAPALDSTRSIICCHGVGELKLVGIFTAESDYSSMRTQSALRVKVMPGLFNVGSSSPGELAVGCGDMVRMQLLNGRLRFPIPMRRDGPILNHLLPINSEMESDAWRSIEGLERPAECWVITPYFAFITHLLHTLERRKHGGSLLIIPDDQVQHLNESLIRIKYRMQNVSAWRMCTDWVTRLIKSAHLRSEVSDGDNVATTPQNSIEESYQSIMRFAEFVGNLGCVDGAVVITEKLKIVGFGAEITAHQQQETQVFVHTGLASEPRKISVEQDGTRHRSVVRFCNAIPGAVGFVLSQDGGIKVAKLGNSGVEMWTDVVPSLGH